ncbi:PQQ-binding-like beta-propeller repeat protein [Solihabitans fulvus]|uniref:PQQ-binding-like beta-propeller repeat protein n=2 Tax=Solihabitans fulvus TaxID=1892852 RepID=A0A5B2WTV9_9PSEU|nr:PQQ-binding-like beta-propeller repeat protein [Solihabitans fulvus]
MSLAVLTLAVAALDGAATASAAHHPRAARIVAGPGHPAPVFAVDWPTYHRDNTRHGTAPGLPRVGALSVAWRAPLDGAVYGQPLVIGGRVIAATEHDTVYALSVASGTVQWSTNLGSPVPLSSLPCGNIDPLGITGTPVYDPDTGRVFVVAETNGGNHDLVGVNVTTGAVEVRVPVEPPMGDPLAHQQRGALTLLGGRVYVPYGGLLGDCGSYIGSVVSVRTDGSGPVQSYAVPTTREGGIWAPAGGVVDQDRLLFAVGNGESSTAFDGSDSVLALSPELGRVDFFAPSTWADDNARDLDLGSASPTLVGPYVLTAGKRGTGYVLRHDSLGGVGGEVAQASMCRSFGGSAVDDDGTVYLPCTDGTRAIAVDAAGSPTVRWHAAVAARGSPAVGGGAVWVVDYDAGTLYALDPASGQVLAQVAVGTAPHFASPTLARQRAFVGTMAGVTAVNGA